MNFDSPPAVMESSLLKGIRGAEDVLAATAGFRERGEELDGAAALDS
jgi:hypothetical protein